LRDLAVGVFERDADGVAAGRGVAVACARHGGGQCFDRTIAPIHGETRAIGRRDARDAGYSADRGIGWQCGGKRRYDGSRVGIEIKANQHRIMVGRTIGCGGITVVGFEFGVVVEHDGLVGVDMPNAKPGHLRFEAAAGKRMVKHARFARIHIGVAIRRRQAVMQVFKASRLDRGDRVFFQVCIEVTDHQYVFFARSAYQRRHPAVQCFGLFDSTRVPAALTEILFDIRRRAWA